MANPGRANIISGMRPKAVEVSTTADQKVVRRRKRISCGIICSLAAVVSLIAIAPLPPFWACKESYIRSSTTHDYTSFH